MPAGALTGSRIRERRSFLRVKQADLARSVGISPAYLNLIEHNRRRIGGKLLIELARALDVDPAQLTEGAEAELVSALRAAAAGDRPGQSDPAPEPERIEEFAGRFPGWAGLTARQARRIAMLERTVAALTDRMTHDPFLSASMHDVLSTVTAIRSASAILTETPDIDPEWRARFHRNIYEDSQRLADGAQALVTYLDGAETAETGASSPQEELEAWLGARGHHLPELERALPATPESILHEAGLATAAARSLAQAYLARYRADAEALPLQPFLAALAEHGPDPARLAARFGADLPVVLRRLAAVPAAEGEEPLGLVICDGSGTLTFRKPLEDFPLPRFGAACPLWPLYQALSRPMTPVRAVVDLPGRRPARFLTYAVSQPAGPPGFDAPPVFEATMLILPESRARLPDAAVLPVGTSCRICPRRNCAGRREPAIVAEEG